MNRHDCGLCSWTGQLRVNQTVANPLAQCLWMQQENYLKIMELLMLPCLHH